MAVKKGRCLRWSKTGVRRCLKRAKTRRKSATRRRRRSVAKRTYRRRRVRMASGMARKGSRCLQRKRVYSRVLRKKVLRCVKFSRGRR